MPRSELNSPTHRIGRILDDVDELDAAYDEMAQAFALAAPAAFEGLAPKPLLPAVISERTRRQLTLGKVASRREYMRRRRSGAAPAIPPAPLDAETVKAIMADVEKELE